MVELHAWAMRGRPCAVSSQYGGRKDYWRYCWMRVVRNPARPCWSIEACQERNSSTVSVYRAQASSSDKRPPRTAATTSAFRRMTQRLVVVGGKSAIVSGLPSGPMTYLTLGRWGSFIGILTNKTRLTGTAGKLQAAA